jgi:glycine cleavage system T protein (aminomethyltransferase)
MATARPRLLLPGLLPPDPWLERYRVRPGGATVVTLGVGDRLTVIDRDGGQRAEVTSLAPDGREDPAALDITADSPATVLGELVASDTPDGQALVESLAARGLNPLQARAAVLFGEWSPPGSSSSFAAGRSAIVVIGAPSSAAVVEGGTPSDLIVEIRRTEPRTHDEMDLPPPLAEPRLDFRVDRATALSYEVKAGEYIQVIDVEGRECSDFLAFNRPRLEDGVERGLDPTVTRTLMGNAYPQPGLYGKFYDQDMVPLVEVVRDTVGRHDTFALACTSKYYEDMGYFGHTNCTDNFNRQLDSYAIAARKGWPALNFFFNTAFTAENILVVDEPWSRPGDYVLLRALTDLVCASSACPDDIDPANAWDPTDIHVRVYPAERTFSAAIAHRVTPDAEPVLTKRTGFQPRIEQLTNRFIEYRGYWLPTSFDNLGAIDEYWACREKAVVMDLSPLRKFEVLGPDAEELLQRTVTRDIRRLSIGQVVYTAMCNDTGGMIDDATVFRLGRDNFRFVGGDEYDGVWLKEQAERLGLRVWIKPSTDQLHNLSVQGPASRDLLKPIVWTPPAQTAFSDLTWFRFSVARIGDYRGIPIVVSRTGYTGELGYELWCHPRDAGALWDAVWDAGRPFGLTPLGLEALDIVRIEAGLIFAGYEFDDQVDPFEAGIGFTVGPSTTDEDFVGRPALEERKEHPQRRLVGLELEGNESAAHGDCVHVGRHQVGVITSGTRSPLLQKNIALCRMAIQHSDLGTEVEVGKLDSHQKRIPATVVRFPFYDPEKTRPRS